LTPAVDDRREVIAEIWYPAEPGTGRGAPYYPDLPRVAGPLAASGEVSALEVFGLRWIRVEAFLEAEVSRAAPSYPVVILSPGNATNVEFYTALAGDLASHGYVVFGLNHPYDSAAVALSSGEVAQYAAEAWPMEFQAHQAFVKERIGVRVQDVLFVLDQLEELNAEEGSRFTGRLDLSQIGGMGHSLGGITAAQACAADPRLKSCLNLDGLQAGGPFSASPNPQLPAQPFMLITKEAQLHPAILALFEKLPAAGYLVKIEGASHDHFTDGPLLYPSLTPLPNRADRFFDTIRAYTLAFFNGTLKGIASPLLEAVRTHPPADSS
jgi:dienelactone hydrolase